VPCAPTLPWLDKAEVGSWNPPLDRRARSRTMEPASGPMRLKRHQGRAASDPYAAQGGHFGQNVEAQPMLSVGWLGMVKEQARQAAPLAGSLAAGRMGHSAIACSYLAVCEIHAATAELAVARLLPPGAGLEGGGRSSILCMRMMAWPPGRCPGASGLQYT
jgi:hypothetical protein